MRGTHPLAALRKLLDLEVKAKVIGAGNARNSCQLSKNKDGTTEV